MAAKKKDLSSAFGLDVEPENKNSETKEENAPKQAEETLPEVKDNIEVEQVAVKTFNIIENNNVVVQDRQFNELEQYYLRQIAEIREKMNNPSPISRLNKRKQGDEDLKRNVTFNIRTDVSYVLDYIVDDAKVFKNKFQEIIVLLGLEEYIKRYGIEMRTFK